MLSTSICNISKWIDHFHYIRKTISIARLYCSSSFFYRNLESIQGSFSILFFAFWKRRGCVSELGICGALFNTQRKIAGLSHKLQDWEEMERQYFNKRNLFGVGESRKYHRRRILTSFNISLHELCNSRSGLHTFSSINDSVRMCVIVILRLTSLVLWVFQHAIFVNCSKFDVSHFWYLLLAKWYTLLKHCNVHWCTSSQMFPVLMDASKQCPPFSPGDENIAPAFW